MRAEDVARAVQQALEKERYEATKHFWEELRADEFVLADLHSAFDAVEAVTDAGCDQAGNPKYELTGSAADGRRLSVVCSLKAMGWILFITVYEAGES